MLTVRPPASAAVRALGLTAADVAAEAGGLNPAFVARVLRGVERPTPRVTAAVERLTGSPVSRLFPPDDPVVTAVAAVVAAAPPLTDEQRARLKLLLGP